MAAFTADGTWTCWILHQIIMEREMMILRTGSSLPKLEVGREE